jgi:hypothetical protein
MFDTVVSALTVWSFETWAICEFPAQQARHAACSSSGRRRFEDYGKGAVIVLGSRAGRQSKRASLLAVPFSFVRCGSI